MKHLRFQSLCALIALIGSTTTCSPLHADDDMAKDRAIAKAAGLLTPEQAGEKALTAKAGTVIEIDLDRGFKGYYYEAEIIDADAVEWEVHIDAKTGAVRGVRKDWFD
jgi:uncharacterized membrane protein YkoI